MPRIDEPLEVRGEIPVTLPPNTMGNEAYTTCFYAFNLNGLVVAGSGDQLVLDPARNEAQGSAPGTKMESRTGSADPALPAGLPEVRPRSWRNIETSSGPGPGAPFSSPSRTS